MKKISIVSACFNEVENIAELYSRVSSVISKYKNYEFEYIFIDNCSNDRTLDKLKIISRNDSRVKIIVNNRNFGHLRSPYYGVIQSSGDATIYLASDLQDPPELIPNFISAWEKGSKVILAAKPESESISFLNFIRKYYYIVLNKISDVSIIKDATGFGLYDRSVLDKIREIADPYPYFRGLVSELGYKIDVIQFNQPSRKRGFSKNNIYSLYDLAMLGFISHSLLPIRIAAFLGIAIGLLSVLSAMIIFFAKIIWWNAIPIGVAPIAISIFFMFGILFILIGILGEYVGSIHTYVKNRPIVVERERINF